MKHPVLKAVRALKKALAGLSESEQQLVFVLAAEESEKQAPAAKRGPGRPKKAKAEKAAPKRKYTKRKTKPVEDPETDLEG
jgi:hypothetical protein